MAGYLFQNHNLLTGLGSKGSTSHYDYSHGDYSHGDYSHGDYSHGDYSHGDFSHGDYSHVLLLKIKLIKLHKLRSLQNVDPKIERQLNLGTNCNNMPQHLM